MGLEKLIDIIFEFILDILPCFIVKEWEKAVVLRNGKLHRVREKGIYWKFPFFEEPLKYVVVTTTMETPVQTLITSDDQDVTIKAVVKYSLNDVVAHTTQIYDAADAIVDSCQAVIMWEVNSHTYAECRDTSEMSHTITKKARAEVKRYGVYIEQITLTNFIKTRNFRIFKDAAE